MQDRKFTDAVLKDGVQDWEYFIPGATIKIEDTWVNVYGSSWMWAQGNPACMIYAMRSAASELPVDDDVWYGKINGLGYLVHESELV